MTIAFSLLGTVRSLAPALVLVALVAGTAGTAGAAGAAGAARAAEPQAAESECTTHDDRRRLADGILGELDEIASRIEAVPPEERAYLERERSAALRQRNEARIQAVQARRYYRAFELHRKIERARLAVRTAELILGDSDRRRSLVRNWAQAAVTLHELAPELSEYRDVDRRRPAPVLEPRRYHALYSGALMLSAPAVDAAACAAVDPAVR